MTENKLMKPMVCTVVSEAAARIETEKSPRSSASRSKRFRFSANANPEASVILGTSMTTSLFERNTLRQRLERKAGKQDCEVRPCRPGHGESRLFSIRYDTGGFPHLDFTTSRQSPLMLLRPHVSDAALRAEKMAPAYPIQAIEDPIPP